MSFILLGFSQQDTIRHFDFLRLAADGSRTEFAVEADLQMARSCDVKLQELPLICRRLLEAQSESVETRALTVSEADLRARLMVDTGSRRGEGGYLGRARRPLPDAPLAEPVSSSLVGMGAAE